MKILHSKTVFSVFVQLLFNIFLLLIIFVNYKVAVTCICGFIHEVRNKQRWLIINEI